MNEIVGLLCVAVVVLVVVAVTAGREHLRMRRRSKLLEKKVAEVRALARALDAVARELLG